MRVVLGEFIERHARHPRVRTLKEKWLELSTPNSVDIQRTAVAVHALTLSSKGQRSRSRAVIKCAAGVGMHVAMTARVSAACIGLADPGYDDKDEPTRAGHVLFLPPHRDGHLQFGRLLRRGRREGL